MKTLLKKLSRDERGVSALEYAILAGVIVVAVIAGFGTFGTELETALKTLTGQITGALPSTTP